MVCLDSSNKGTVFKLGSFSASNNIVSNTDLKITSFFLNFRLASWKVIYIFLSKKKLQQTIGQLITFIQCWFKSSKILTGILVALNG